MHRTIFHKTTSIEDKAIPHKNKAERTLKTQKKRKTGIKRPEIKIKKYLAKFS